MATYIKDLKEDNGDIVYPHTNTDAVYTSGGETLETRISKYVTAEDIAQSVQSFGTVTTGMLDDDAITTAKIDDGAVTAAKLGSDSVTTAKIADESITNAKVDWDNMANNGNWILVDEKTLTSAITSETPLTVTIPADYQGGLWEYEVKGSLEASFSSSSNHYVFLQPQVNGTWFSNCYFSYSGCRNGAAVNYMATTATDRFGMEWNFYNSNDSCVFTTYVSRGGTATHWTSHSQIGGMSTGGAGVVFGGGRIGSNAALTAFRIKGPSGMSWVAGCSLKLFARKRQTA